MGYRIERDSPSCDASGNYSYRIYEDDSLIAFYWHDFRGDAHGIKYLDGTTDYCPVGLMIDFVHGGGPKPLTLSEQALVHLRQKRSKDS